MSQPPGRGRKRGWESAPLEPRRPVQRARQGAREPAGMGWGAEQARLHAQQQQRDMQAQVARSLQEAQNARLREQVQARERAQQREQARIREAQAEADLLRRESEILSNALRASLLASRAPPPPPPSSSSSVTRDGSCMYFMSGHCRLGAQCPHRHEGVDTVAHPAPAKKREKRNLSITSIATRVTSQKQLRALRLEDCCVCLEAFTAPKAKPIFKLRDCKHVFHLHCLTEWSEFGESCPLCDTPLFKEE